MVVVRRLLHLCLRGLLLYLVAIIWYVVVLNVRVWLYLKHHTGGDLEEWFNNYP